MQSVHLWMSCYYGNNSRLKWTHPYQPEIQTKASLLLLDKMNLRSARLDRRLFIHPSTCFVCGWFTAGHKGSWSQSWLMLDVGDLGEVASLSQSEPSNKQAFTLTVRSICNLDWPNAYLRAVGGNQNTLRKPMQKRNEHANEKCQPRASHWTNMLFNVFKLVTYPWDSSQTKK